MKGEKSDYRMEQIIGSLWKKNRGILGKLSMIIIKVKIIWKRLWNEKRGWMKNKDIKEHYIMKDE